MDRPFRSDPSCPILKMRPNCPPSGAAQQDTHHCWQAEGDCIDWFGATCLQCEFNVLQIDDPEGPPSRQAARTRGYQWLIYPILGVCWGQLTDPRYKGLWWECLAAGHRNHDLFWEGTSHGGVQDYRQDNGNDHKRGTSQDNCDLNTSPHWCGYVWVTPAAWQTHRGLGYWKKGYSLCSPWPYWTQRIMSGWHLGACPYHMEGNPSI